MNQPPCLDSSSFDTSLSYAEPMQLPEPKITAMEAKAAIVTVTLSWIVDYE